MPTASVIGGILAGVTARILRRMGRPTDVQEWTMGGAFWAGLIALCVLVVVEVRE